MKNLSKFKEPIDVVAHLTKFLIMTSTQDWKLARHKEVMIWKYKHSVINELAVIGPNALVLGTVIDSAAVDYAVVGPKASVTEHSTIEGNAFLMGSATLSGFSVMRDDAYVDGDSKVTNFCVINGTAQISGTAWIRNGVVLAVPVKLTAGTWNKRPIFIQGSRWNCYQPKPNAMTIGCSTLTFKEWKKHKKALVEYHGLTLGYVKEYTAYYNVMKNQNKELVASQ